MKKSRLAFLIFFAATLICAVFTLAACTNGSDIVELRVENAKINFLCGEEFETGEDFKVYAEHKNGEVEDVTAAASVRQESGMDMNVAGDYQITVAYADKRVIYTVYVNQSADVLRKIEADTSAVKKQYRVGDALELDGITLKLTYENEHGARYTTSVTSLDGLDVSVTSADGVVIDDVFTALGAFTVTIAKDGVKTSFGVTVDGVNISTVRSALAVGGYYAKTVKSGTAVARGAYSKTGALHTNSSYEYEYGNGYTYFKDTNERSLPEYHCSVDADGFYVVYTQNGTVKPSDRNNADMIYGVPVLLWYSSETEYGPENALNNLYSHAVKCSNDDLTETADVDTRSYSFKFSGLEFRDHFYDYYETEVSFVLGEDNAVKSASILQDYYENNSALSEQPGYVPTFITDRYTGKTTPNGDCTYRVTLTLEQTTGERTATNPYSRKMFEVSSYKLMYRGSELTDESVLECEAGNEYLLEIAAVTPVTANIDVDVVRFNYEGSFNPNYDFWLSTEHFSVTRDGSTIKLIVKHGGSWTLLLKTNNTQKRLTIEVKGQAPDEMTPKLYNDVSGSFYDGSEKTVAKNGAVYFYGAVGAYDDPSQTVTVKSGNGEYAEITEAEKAGVKCWKFTASEAGVYQVEVVSAVNVTVRYTFSFTVSEQSDLSAILTGKYTATDRGGVIYEVTFDRADGDILSGTVTVKCTPTDLNDEPLPDQAVQGTFDFYVDGMNIVVTHPDDDAIGADFAVNDKGEFVLIDKRLDSYVLSRVGA